MANDIGRIHPLVIRKTFELFYNSIARHNTDFQIFLYTNLPHAWFAREQVRIFDSSENDFLKLYPDRPWFNLTFHRFHLLKKHLERGDNPIWIDLDTIIAGNIEHLASYPNLFIKYGFGETPSVLNSKLSLPQKEWIHGHLFKIDHKIVSMIEQLLDQDKDDLPQYELMSFFTLLQYRHPEHFIILNNLTDKIINFEWCFEANRPPTKPNSLTEDHFHPEPCYIKDRIKVINGRPYGYDGREFLLITFTFYTLEMNMRENWKSIADPAAQAWLRSLCHVSAIDRLKSYLIHAQSLLNKDNLKKTGLIKFLRRTLQK